MNTVRTFRPTEAEGFIAAYAKYSDDELLRLADEAGGVLRELRLRVLRARRPVRRQG